MAVNTKQIQHFFKLLVEWGGVYHVDEEDMFIKKPDGELVTIKVGNSDLPMMLFHEDMKVGKHTFFNPLVETLGHSSEKKWFFQSRSLIAGVIVKELIKKIIELCVEKSEDDKIDYDIVDILTTYVKRVDKKMLQEVEKIEPINLLRIYYSKKNRVAQLQTDIYDEEFVNELKWRKNTISVVRDMLSEFLGSDNIHEDYVYKATIISMQETDAFLNIMLKFTLSVHEYCSSLLDRNLFASEFEQHMEHLNEYRKACAWAVTGTIQHDREANKPDTPTPWRPSSQSTPMMVQPPGGYNPPSQVGTNNDPALFAKLASALNSNPYLDMNQVLNSYINPQQYGNQMGFQPQGGVISNMGIPQLMPVSTLPQLNTGISFEEEGSATRLPKPKCL